MRVSIGQIYRVKAKKKGEKKAKPRRHFHGYRGLFVGGQLKSLAGPGWSAVLGYRRNDAAVFFIINRRFTRSS